MSVVSVLRNGAASECESAYQEGDFLGAECAAKGKRISTENPVLPVLGFFRNGGGAPDRIDGDLIVVVRAGGRLGVFQRGPFAPFPALSGRPFSLAPFVLSPWPFRPLHQSFGSSMDRAYRKAVIDSERKSSPFRPSCHSYTSFCSVT